MMLMRVSLLMLLLLAFLPQTMMAAPGEPAATAESAAAEAPAAATESTTAAESTATSAPATTDAASAAIAAPAAPAATEAPASPASSTTIAVVNNSKYDIIPPEGTHNGKDVEQPIEFPHDIHVKVNKINCMYCHTYARRSKVAGIPPTSKCMGCHKVIATDKERIIKLTQYWKDKKEPRWKKVHDVPDFVHFTHEKHLKKFVFDRDYPVKNVKEVCAFCHGYLENMTVAKKVKPLNMGFCKNCHIENGGPGDCWKCHK